MPRRPMAKAADQPAKKLPIRIGDVPPTDTVPKRLVLLAEQLQVLFDARADRKASSPGGSGIRRH